MLIERSSPGKLGGGSHAAVAIEGGDHLIPPRNERVQVGPELLAAAELEVGEGNALLLDPGEVAEVEDAGPFQLSGFQHVLPTGTQQVLPDQLGRQRLRHVAAIVPALEV